MSASKPSSPLFDVFIVHTPMEWQVAQAIGRLLVAHGYSVSATQRLEYPGCPGADARPADARATIVVWPLDVGLCDMLEMEARAAAQRERLVQVYAGHVRPSETYPGPAPVDFTGWDYTRPGPRWTTLLRRLRPLCGAPARRPIDPVATTQAVVLCTTLAIALASIFAALGQSGGHRELIAAKPDPVLQPPEVAPIRTVEDLARATPVHPGVDSGGPAKYEVELGDIDQGVDIEKLPPAEAPAPPPEPPARSVQGPEL